MAKLLKLQVDRPCLIPPGPLAAATRDPPFVNPGAELIPHGTQDLRKLGYLDSKQSIHSQPGRERGHWGPWLTAAAARAWQEEAAEKHSPRRSCWALGHLLGIKP